MRKIADVKKVLLVVDLQPEFRDKDGVYEECVNFVNTQFAKAPRIFDEIIATKCRNYKGSNYEIMANWQDCMNSCEELAFPADRVIEKTGYGLDCYEEAGRAVLEKDALYMIIGFNADACVLKVALDLFDRGYTFCVATDKCGSSSSEAHRQRGIDVMKSLIPNALLTTDGDLEKKLEDYAAFVENRRDYISEI